MAVRRASDFTSRRSKEVRDLVEYEKFLREQLQEPYSAMVRYWNLYLGQIEDNRDPETEYWRAAVHVPYPYSVVETEVAAYTDILMSADPLVQAEGVGDEDYAPSSNVERLIDYTYRANLWRSKLENLLRERSIQGVVAFKEGWRRDIKKVWLAPDDAQLERFNKSMQEAASIGLVCPYDWQTQPEEFMKWRDLVNRSGRWKKGTFPAPPYSGEQLMVRYQGPWMTRIPIFETRWDPRIAEIDQQPCIILRSVKDESWLKMRTGAGDDFIFDPAAVEEAIGSGGGSAWSTAFNEFEDEISRMLGVNSGRDRNPVYRKPVEVWECWYPFDEERPYRICLNRTAFINKKQSWPFGHSELPWTILPNSPVPGHLLGQSTLAQPESLFYEQDALRSLRLDAVTLDVLPMFAKARELGMPELRRIIKPGAIFEADPNKIQQISKGNQGLAAAFREGFETKQDIDETAGTPAQLRGNASTVGRVSATESERRYSQALVRMKQGVMRIEEALTPSIHRFLALWHEFGPSEIRIKVSGADPFINVTREELYESLDQNYRFRGASRALNKDMQVQQMMEYGKNFGQQLIPSELRTLMVRVWEGMGLKGAREIVTDRGTQIGQQMWDMQQQLALANLMMQMAQLGLPQQGLMPGAEQPQDPSMEMGAGGGGVDFAGLLGQGGGGPMDAQVPSSTDTAGQEVEQSLREGDQVANPAVAPGQMMM